MLDAVDAAFWSVAEPRTYTVLPGAIGGDIAIYADSIYTPTKRIRFPVHAISADRQHTKA
jgi:hypothetical protein